MMRFLLALPLVLGVASARPRQTVTLKLATIVGNDNPFTPPRSSSRRWPRPGARPDQGRGLSRRAAREERDRAAGRHAARHRRRGGGVAASIGGKWDPKLLATDVPFLYTGREHVWKVMDGALGKELMNRLEPLGAKPFCYGAAGLPRVLSNKRAIQAPTTSRADHRVPPIPTLVEVFKAFARTRCR